MPSRGCHNASCRRPPQAAVTPNRAREPCPSSSIKGERGVECPHMGDPRGLALSWHLLLGIS